MMSLTPEWLIKNPVTPGTMMNGGMGYQNAEQWQISVSGMNTVMGRGSVAEGVGNPPVGMCSPL